MFCATMAAALNDEHHSSLAKGFAKQLRRQFDESRVQQNCICNWWQTVWIEKAINLQSTGELLVVGCATHEGVVSQRHAVALGAIGQGSKKVEGSGQQRPR